MANITLTQQLAVKQTGPDEFTSTQLPRFVGDRTTIAYGGFTAAIAVQSAYTTVSSTNHHIFSILGSFLGPTYNNQHIICRVSRTRDTKTFITRRVAAYQTQKDGKERICAELFIDFHVLESELMRYSAPPSELYNGDPDDSNSFAQLGGVAERMVSNGSVPRATADIHSKWLFLTETFFEVRTALTGMSAQNLNGMAKHLATTQDHLPTSDRSSAEYIRLRKPAEGAADNAVILSFLMDGALSPLPLALGPKGFFDVDTFLTLDFAVRIMTPKIEMGQWHLRERKTIAAAVGRSYSEARLWREDRSLVAVASQTCILRPKKALAKV